jgi:hypothetical protein
MITAVMLIMRPVLGIAALRTNDRSTLRGFMRFAEFRAGLNEPEKAVNRLTARQLQTHALFEQRDRLAKVAVS